MSFLTVKGQRLPVWTSAARNAVSLWNRGPNERPLLSFKA